MALNDKPNLFLAILAATLAGLLGVDAFGLGFDPWVYVLVFGLVWMALAQGWNWVTFQHFTHVLWANTAKSAQWYSIMQILDAVAQMPAARFEALINMVIAAQGDDEDRAIAVADMHALAEEMRQAAQATSAGPASGMRYYATSAVEFARKNHGWLPAKRSAGDGTLERKTYDEYYALLERAGVICPAVGNNPAKVLDIERAEQIAKGMEAGQ